MEEFLEGEFSQVKVGVRFQRRSGYYLLTLYIPTVLLVSIAYFTLYFNPIDFNSRIVVALTSLLVLTSLFTQVGLGIQKKRNWECLHLISCTIIYTKKQAKYVSELMARVGQNISQY